MNTNEIESQFQLLNTSILSLEVVNTFFEYDEKISGNKTIDVGYNIVRTDNIEEKNAKMGILDLHITLSCEIEDKTFSIYLISRGIFKDALETADDQFEKMLKINGCASLYTMARATINVISTQMFSYGNIVLPLVNFVKFHQMEEENK